MSQIIRLSFSIAAIFALAAYIPADLSAQGRRPAAAHEPTPVWKEYVFSQDGFKITLPAAPSSHAEPTLPDMTVYSVSLQPEVRLSVHISHLQRDCTTMLPQLKNGALKHGPALKPHSVKDLGFMGHPGLEYEYQDEYSPGYEAYERFYCVNGEIYAFTARWPDKQRRPSSLMRAINSFRLLPPK